MGETKGAVGEGRLRLSEDERVKYENVIRELEDYKDLTLEVNHGRGTGKIEGQFKGKIIKLSWTEDTWEANIDGKESEGKQALELCQKVYAKVSKLKEAQEKLGNTHELQEDDITRDLLS